MTNRESLCCAVSRWLDDGGAPRHPDAARLLDHASRCASCGAATAAARAVEALLEEASQVPAGFADAVMARIAVDALTAAPGAQPEPVRAAWWREVWRSPEVAGGFAAGVVTAGVLPLLASALAKGDVRRDLAHQWNGVRLVLEAHPAAMAGAVCIGVLVAIPLARGCYRWASEPRAGRR